MFTVRAPYCKHNLAYGYEVLIGNSSSFRQFQFFLTSAFNKDFKWTRSEN